MRRATLRAPLLRVDARDGASQSVGMRWTYLAIAIVGVAASTAAYADDDAICADRPGKATATCTVPAGSWQIETGITDWSLQRGNGQRETTLILGETVVKRGLSDTTDVGVDFTPYVRIASRDHGVRQKAAGIGDLSLQLKHRLTDENASLQISLLPVVTAPIAKHEIGASAWQFATLVPVSFDIAGSPLSLGLTPEMDWVADSDGHGRHLAMAQVASLGWQASNKLTLSAELWGQWDWDPAETTRQASVDGSIAYLANKKLQLDAGANVGLNRNTPDLELYGGFSVRF
jgi:hypothetical protein